MFDKAMFLKNTIRVLPKFFFIVATILPLITLLFYIFGYQYTLAIRAGWSLIIVLILIPIYVWMYKSLKGKWRTFASDVAIPISFFSIFIWIGSLAFLDFSYSSISSPINDKEIIIEHRNFTKGETNHFYNFYEKVPYVPVMKRLNDETVHFYTRNVRANTLEILGVDKTIWSNQYVIFPSPYTKDIKVEF